MIGYLLWGLVPVGIALAVARLAWFLRSKAPRSYIGYEHEYQAVGLLALAALSAIVLVLGVIIAIANAVSVTACEHYGERMGLEWDYSAWTTCLVELPDGRWVDVDAVENNHLTGEVTLKGDER